MSISFEAAMRNLLKQVLWSGMAHEAGCEPVKPGKRKNRRTKAMQLPHQVEPVEKAFDAIKRGDLAGLDELVTTAEQANWLREGKPWCLLDEAVRCQSLPMVTRLLDKGANPNMLFRNDHLHNHLLSAVIPGLYFSPLAAAIREGMEDIVVLLLTRGASLGLPVWYDVAEGLVTCQDMAVECGLWSRIEARLIAQETAEPVPAPPRAKRI